MKKRIENQLRIHWYWLKETNYKNIAKFVIATVKIKDDYISKRIENQLENKWHWLKKQEHKDVAKFIVSIIEERKRQKN